MAEPLLRVHDLEVMFPTEDGVVTPLAGVTLDLMPGETLALVGESGSGKSLTSLAIMGLLPDGGRLTRGHIDYRGERISEYSERQLQKLRGNKIAMIFQDPMTSMNPVYRVGQQISEAIVHHQNLSSAAARSKAVEMLELVGIPEPDKRAESYPHQLSGGMRQRAMIAMALACEPDILIADEPTTALDVTIQAQILELIKELQERINMSVLFITHDLGVVAEIAHRVAVMYCGRIVEQASADELFERPLMPYTQGLLRSIPHLGMTHGGAVDRLKAIPGTVPSPLSLPDGCSFSDRCDFTEPRCSLSIPSLEKVSSEHWARCIKWQEIESSEGSLHAGTS